MQKMGRICIVLLEPYLSSSGGFGCGLKAIFLTIFPVPRTVPGECSCSYPFRCITLAANMAAPYPLSILTTAIPGEQEESIPAKAANPPKDTP